MNLKTIAAMALDEFDVETDVFIDDEEDSVVYEDPIQYVVRKDKPKSRGKGNGKGKTKSSVAEDATVFSDALDEMIREGGKEKSPSKEGYHTFVFKFKINAPKFAKRFGVEIPDDSSDAIDSAVRDSFLVEAQDASVSENQHLSRRNLNANSPWVRNAVATPLEECRAGNPMTCRFHGVQAIANDIEATVRNAFSAAGKNFGGNVDVSIDGVHGNIITCTVSVSADAQDADIVSQAMRNFANQPGVDSYEGLGTDGEYEGSVERPMEFDFDQLNPDAKARWGIGEERPSETVEAGETSEAQEQPGAATPVSAEAEPATEAPAAPPSPGLAQAQQNLAFAQMMLGIAPESMKPMVQAMVDAAQRMVDELTPATPSETTVSETPAETAEPEQDVLAPAAAAEEEHEEAAEQTEQAPSEESAASTREVSAQPIESETTAQPQAGISDLDGAVAAVAGNGQIPSLTYREAIEGALNGDEADRRFLERKLGADSPVLGWIDGQRNGAGAAAVPDTPTRAERELTEGRMRETEQTERDDQNNAVRHDYNEWLNSRLGPENAGTVASLPDVELEGIVNGSASEGNQSLLTPQSAAIELALRALSARYNGRRFDDNEASELITNAIGGNRGAQNVLRSYIGEERYSQLMRTSDTQSARNQAQSSSPRPSPTPVQATTPAQHAVAEAQAHEVAPQFVSATPVANPYSAAQDQSSSRNEAVSDDLRNNLIAEYNRAKGEKQRLGQLLMEQGITVAGRNGEQVPDFNNRESGAAMKARRFASYLSALGKVIGGYSHRRPTAAERRAHPDQIGEDGRITFQAGHQLGGFNNRGDMMNRMQAVMTDAFNAARDNPLGQGSTQYKRTKDALRFLGSKLGANVTVDDSNGNLNVEWTDHPNNDTFDYGYIDEGRTASDARAARGGSQSAVGVSAERPTESATQQVAEPAAPAENNTTQRQNTQGQSAAEQSLAQSIQNVQNPQVRDILQRIQSRASGRQ